MFAKDDFYWKEKDTGKIRPVNVVLESCYSPGHNIYIRKSETDEVVFRVLCIKSYKVTFETIGDTFINIVEYLNEYGNIDHLYNTQSHKQLYVEALDYGDLLSNVESLAIAP